MLILTIFLSLALAALFTLLPARIHHRRPVRADLYAGAGVSALVWLWAVCIWSRPGLTVDFDGFRLVAILAMQGLSCGIVCGFRLRGALPQKLRTPAAGVLLLVASLGAEVFIGNLSWLATSRYTPVDLRPYLTNDPDPAAPLTLQGDSTVLEFADLGFEVYNLQLDGLVSLAASRKMSCSSFMWLPRMRPARHPAKAGAGRLHLHRPAVWSAVWIFPAGPIP